MNVPVEPDNYTSRVTDLCDLVCVVEPMSCFQHWHFAIRCHPRSHEVNHPTHFIRLVIVQQVQPLGTLLYMLLNLHRACVVS